MKKIIILVTAFSAMLLAACRNDNMAEDTPQGSLSLSLGVALSNESASVITRAAMTNDELLNTATIKIYNGDFSGLVRSYTNSTKPAAIYLPAEKYRVDIEAGERVKASPAVASWEQKSYKGSSEFTITAGTTTPVQVVAKVCNVISKPTFDASIAESFETGYTFKIGLSATDATQQLSYDASKAGTEGYFIADGFEPSLFWTFTGTLKKDGSTFTKSGEIKAVEQGKLYAMSMKYTEKDGTLSMTLMVDMATEDHNDEIVFVPVSTGLSKSSIYEIWAGHATIHADVDETEYGTTGIKFEYRVSSSETWSSIDATRKDEGVYTATLTSLQPATEYEYRLIAPDPTTKADTVIGSSMTITTETAPTVPNASFEETSNAESSKYLSFYNPSSTITANQTKWWDSGNAGSTSVGASSVITYTDSSEYKDGAQSVCLQSRYVVIKFAAGNIFSGSFGETITSGSKTGGTVFFGRPFTGRPTALRCWIKYSTSTCNRIDTYPDNDSVTSSDYDRAQLKVALGTWDYRTYGGTRESPVLVNTTNTSTFVDFNTDASTIAYGQKILQGDASNSTNTWQQITIPLDYKDTNKYPTHIIISAAASMLGDYFTGSDSSKLWLDGVELLYE